MKTCLVTGGAGFIGANFIRYIREKHPNVRILNLDALTYAGNLENLAGIPEDGGYRFIRGDICDVPLVEGIFSEFAPDTVVHFAAESHVDRSITDPGLFARTNILGTMTLLNAAKAAWSTGEDTYQPGVRFHQVSTDEVYGSLGAEGFFTEETPLSPHSPYSSSKASADFFVKAYADTYKLPVTITRCSNNYGAYQFPEKLIPLILHNALQHKTLPVYGDGLQIRDWLYVEDHCRAIDLVLEGGRPGEVYNVGGHNERTNLAIIRTILAYLAENVDPTIDESLIRHVADRKGHDRRYGIDPEKIHRELGWLPETSFEEGIVRTIRWYLDNPEWVEHVTSGAYQTYYDAMYGHS